MGWFTGDTIVSNQVAQEETRMIAVVLIILVVVIVCVGFFKAYHAYVKSHINKVIVREVALNNVCSK